MVTAREAFEAKKLATKYGVPGKVAALYRTAGYEVEILSTDQGAAANFRASKRLDHLLVKVYWRTGKVPSEVVEKLAEEAGRENRKPVLVLYGSGPKMSPELAEKARSLGVRIRRVRP